MTNFSLTQCRNSVIIRPVIVYYWTLAQKTLHLVSCFYESSTVDKDTIIGDLTRPILIIKYLISELYEF